MSYHVHHDKHTHLSDNVQTTLPHTHFTLNTVGISSRNMWCELMNNVKILLLYHYPLKKICSSSCSSSSGTFLWIHELSTHRWAVALVLDEMNLLTNSLSRVMRGGLLGTPWNVAKMITCGRSGTAVSSASVHSSRLNAMNFIHKFLLNEDRAGNNKNCKCKNTTNKLCCMCSLKSVYHKM